MNPPAETAQALAAAIRRAFPPHPIPAYPPLLGLDPPGVEDEYAAFTDVPWTDVPPRSHRWNRYDISPTIGLQAHPPSWNYHLPGFLTSALLFEHEIQVLEGVMWCLFEVPPPPHIGAGEPWWGGETLFANYHAAQIECILRFLAWVHDQYLLPASLSVWGLEEEQLLRRWQSVAHR
jgi:hypothetical protein